MLSFLSSSIGFHLVSASAKTRKPFKDDQGLVWLKTTTQQRNRWESKPRILSIPGCTRSAFFCQLFQKHQGCRERRGSHGELFNITWLSRELFRNYWTEEWGKRTLYSRWIGFYHRLCQRAHFIGFGTVRSTVAIRKVVPSPRYQSTSSRAHFARQNKTAHMRMSSVAKSVLVYSIRRSGMAILITISWPLTVLHGMGCPHYSRIRFWEQRAEEKRKREERKILVKSSTLTCGSHVFTCPLKSPVSKSQKHDSSIFGENVFVLCFWDVKALDQWLDNIQSKVAGQSQHLH